MTTLLQEVGVECSLCDNEGIVTIQNAWFCVDHIDDGMRIISKVLRVFRGEEEIESPEEPLL